MKYLAFLSIMFILLALVCLIKDNPTKDSIAESVQLTRFYGQMSLGLICFVGFKVLQNLNSDK